MKNLFKNLMLVAVAAMAFTACTETNDEVNANVEKRVFKFVAGFADDTRSGFLEKEEGATAYKSKWFGDEWLKVYANGVAQEDVKIEDAEGHFSVELTGNTTRIDVYSPASAWNNTTEPTIPTEQTPSANSVDPAAHILKAENVAVNSGVVTMSHAVAYGKMTVNAPQSFDIKNIEVSFNDGTPYVIKADKVENNTFWFATKPAEVSKFTVIAYNDKGKAVAKTVDVAANPDNKTLKFNEGRVSTFSVSGLKAVVEQSSSDYTLVTNVADLAVGDKVIIAAADFDVAMSTNQKTNNRDKVDVTKNGNTIAYVDGIQILTLEAGTKAGTFAFNTGSGYLYAASSGSNHLKTQTTLNDNGSWKIEITAAGVATIKAQGTNTRNWMRYNSATTNGQLFSCYNNGQENVSIYKQGTVVGGDIELADPLFELDVTELSFNAAGEYKVVNVLPLNYFEAEVTATTDAEWLSIENEDYAYTVTAAKNDGDAREAVITFKSGDISHDVTVAQAASVNNADEATVAEFLAAEEDGVTLYRLRGTITGMYQNSDNDYKYGNFYLTDDTGTVLIYGLYSPENTPQYWAESGAQLGDDIEVITVRASYNNTPQGKNAIFVEKQRPGTIAFWSFDKTSASFTSAGGEAKINVAAYNLTEDVECVFEDGDLFEAEYKNGVLTIRAEANSSTEVLNATLYVRSGDLEEKITISQAAYVDPGDVVTATESVDFSAQSYTNGKAITEYVGGNFSIAFNKGSNSNAPKYYASGTAIRCYGGNYFTISSEKTIVAIELTYGSSDGSNAISTDVGTFVSPKWTGESKSVKFTIAGSSGNRRIKGIKVTYVK